MRVYYPFKGIDNSRLGEIGVNLTADPAGSLKNIFRHPLRFLKIAIIIYPLRVIAHLEVYQFGFFDPLYLVNYSKHPNNFMPTLEFYFTAFFLYGMAACLRRPDILKSPIFPVLIFNLFIYAIVFILMTPRYKDTSTPFIYLIGSYGLVLIVRRMRILRKR